ncbi:MAG: T9SS C-terminal target domain-containing protein [Ignavibacteriales bacterium]|nr:MAG: T9SS C-terminal target domain-containing protein [Ignavibacteriales bacterium]
MEGLLTTGEIVNPCDFLFGEILGGLNCDVINPRFWYSGDPVIKQGWLCKVRDDKTDLLSTENFTLIRNQPVDIIVAYTVGHGTDHLSSITDGRNKVRKLFEIYEQNFPGSYTPPNYEEIYPKEFSLSQNYPNPFNPSTTIKFTVPLDVKRETSNTKLVVYDILGREVKTLVNENRAPGSYEITFDASQLASGVYFYRLTSGDFMQTKKMILIR